MARISVRRVCWSAAAARGPYSFAAAICSAPSVRITGSAGATIRTAGPCPTGSWRRSWLNSGLAEQGLLVRHLLMPGGLDEARAIFHFLVGEISPHCYLNIMEQYRPCGDVAHDHIAGRAIEPAMSAAAVGAAAAAGLTRLENRGDLAALLRRLMAR
jgi:hypothetical protein